MRRALSYTEPVKPKGPGIASTHRAQTGAFASLLDQILRDRDALDGLAFAYTELPIDERPALIQAVVQDAANPTRALLALLAVEEDQALCRRLASLVGKHGQLAQSAYLRGGEGHGEASLVQWVAGASAEALKVAWKDNRLEQIEIEARPDLDALAREASVSVAEAVDTLAPLVWRHVRAGGRLPDGAERFAAFFSVS